MQEDDEEQRWIVVFACSTGNNTNTEERCVEIERRVRKRKQKQKMLFSLCHNIKTDIIMRITVHLFEGKVYACCVFFLSYSVFGCCFDIAVEFMFLLRVLVVAQCKRR